MLVLVNGSKSLMYINLLPHTQAQVAKLVRMNAVPASSAAGVVLLQRSLLTA